MSKDFLKQTHSKIREQDIIVFTRTDYIIGGFWKQLLRKDPDLRRFKHPSEMKVYFHF